MLSCSYREFLELTRDPIRLTMAGLGSVILMIIMGYGISLDVEHLNYAVLDRDQTTVSSDYTINIAGSSRYFTERPPVADYEELDRRMRSGELSMVIEIPPGFGRDVERFGQDPEHGKPVRIGVWIDGAMPQRGETIRGYVQGMHLLWLQDVARHRLGHAPTTRRGSAPTGHTRHDRAALPLQPRRQEPGGDGAGGDPAAAAVDPGHAGDALGGPREGPRARSSTSTSRRRRAWSSCWASSSPTWPWGCSTSCCSRLLAVTLFRVPLKGDFRTAAAGALLYVGCSTGIGLLVSTLTRTQVAALFATAVLTLIPAGNFCGLTDPVSSLEGFGRLVGDIYPTTYLHHDLPRHLQQGAGFCRPVRVVPPPADRHPGADRAERGAS